MVYIFSFCKIQRILKKESKKFSNKRVQASQLLIRFNEQYNYPYKKISSITNMKLKWLIVFAEACNLVELGERKYSLNKEIEYWTYGPTIPAIHYKYDVYGQMDLILPEYDFNLKPISYSYNLLSREEAYILKRMFFLFKDINNYDLTLWYLDILNALNQILEDSEKESVLSIAEESLKDSLIGLFAMKEEEYLSDNTLHFFYDFFKLKETESFSFTENDNPYEIH